MKNKHWIFFLLTLLAGIIILVPQINYQPLLAQGDHGRDLYIFKINADGKLPYRDYWWVYGPLMPYYYSLFYKFLGGTIQSILLGKLFLTLLSSAFFYLTIALFAPAALSSLAAIWFLVFRPDFFFTFNHAGGITAMLGTIFCVFLYLKQQKIKYLYLALFCIFILCLIKINFGIFCLIYLFLSVAAIDFLNSNFPLHRKKFFIITSLFFLPVAVFSIYFFLLHKLPFYAIRQCLPYLNSDHPYNSSIINSLGILIKQTFSGCTLGWSNTFFTILILTCLVQTISILIKKQTNADCRRGLIVTLSIPLIFYIGNLHEFLASGVFYRTFWAKPFSMILMFLIINSAVKNSSKILQFLLYSVISLILILQITHGKYELQKIKNPFQYLALEKVEIFIGNHPAWIRTVTDAVFFLKSNMNDDDTFFALPYDPIYYFLCEKDSPIRQLIFFDHINIPPEQEKKIILELERKKVGWVVLSNRSNSTEHGLGTFGKTYCPLIADYLNKNFKTVATFGYWEAPAGWTANHAVRILKKIN